MVDFVPCAVRTGELRDTQHDSNTLPSISACIQLSLGHMIPATSSVNAYLNQIRNKKLAQCLGKQLTM